MEITELNSALTEVSPATGFDGIGVLIAVAAIALAVVLVLVFTK